MVLKKMFAVMLLIGVFFALPLFVQPTTDITNSGRDIVAGLAPSQLTEAQRTPVLWLWRFDVSNPYPNPCTIDWVKVNLNLAAVDTDSNFYTIHVTSKVYNLSGQLVLSTDHGWIASSSSTPIIVVNNAQSLAAGYYSVRVTGECPTLGKSETETKQFIIY